MTATALIIDDEPDIRELIAMTLSRMGLDYHTAANLEEARQLLNVYHFDVCLTDMRLPDGNGVEFVRYAQSKNPNLPIAVITAHGNMEAAVDAMKNGAYDFVSKPVDIQQLRQLVVQAIALNNEEASNEPNFNADKDALETNDSLDKTDDVSAGSLHDLSHRQDTGLENNNVIGSDKLVGGSAPMKSLRQMITKVSRTNAPVWITGESGTGKELIARLIHENGPRSANAFVAINCGAIPSELMESEMFGHRRGSFTGANTDKEGLFQHANGGTLFLDEVAELPLHMQVKLLRAIQERSVRPVGANEETAVDARILSASHKDLAKEVEAGRFRHDLYYRLNVIKLHSPSLRARSQDIPELCQSILAKLAAQHGNEQCMSISEQALETLIAYDFPGNVRELENVLERSIAMADTDTITVEDLSLPENINEESTNRPSLTSVSGNSETNRIMDALNNARWNRKQAAKELGLTYRQLRYRIQQLGIDKYNDSE